MRILPLFVILLLAGPAWAQAFDWQRFYPLEVGDTWIYESCSTFESGPCTGAYFWRRTVVGDTLIGGIEYAVVEQGTVSGENPRQCIERVTEEGEIEWVEEAGCQPPGALGLNLREPAGAGGYPFEEVVIGGESYEPDSVLFFYDYVYGPYVHNVTFASDIGFIGDWYDFMGPGDRGYTFLRYAEVGGVIYGTMPVANEVGAMASAFSLGAAYPNPFRSSVAVALTLPRAEAVALDAFDMLGRRVLHRELGVLPAGPSTRLLDLGEVPAGLYVVRATTASGETAARRLMKVD